MRNWSDFALNRGASLKPDPTSPRSRECFVGQALGLIAMSSVASATKPSVGGNEESGQKLTSYKKTIQGFTDGFIREHGSRFL